MKHTAAMVLVICILPLLAGCGVNKDKLHGTWVVEDGPPAVYDAEGRLIKGVPKGMLWEFTNDGKLKWASQVDGNLVTKEGLTWSISGDFLVTKLDSKEGKARIKELTDSRLVLKDDEQPKEVVFKRVN
jgi:Lipocalin-like domain